MTDFIYSLFFIGLFIGLFGGIFGLLSKLRKLRNKEYKFYDSNNKHLFISVIKAIERVEREVPWSKRVEIINKLPGEYHYIYWINCFNEEFLFEDGNCDNGNGCKINMKRYAEKIEISPNFNPFCLTVKKVDNFIENIKKEKEREEKTKMFHRYGSNPDDGKTIVLKTIDEIMNDLHGTVQTDDPKMNEKLSFIVKKPKGKK